MSDIQNDPSVIKLIEYAKAKKTITYDEANDFLPESISNSDKIEEIISLLEKNKIKLEDDLNQAPTEEIAVVDDNEDIVDSDDVISDHDLENLNPEKNVTKKKVVFREKES